MGWKGGNIDIENMDKIKILVHSVPYLNYWQNADRKP